MLGMTPTQDVASPTTYSVAETATKLNTTDRKVREMVKAGALPSVAEGGRCRIPADVVDAHAARQAGEADNGADVADPATPGTFADHVAAVLGHEAWLLTIEETASVIAQPVSLVRAAVAADQLPTRAMGKRRFIPVLALEAWLSTGEVAA